MINVENPLFYKTFYVESSTTVFRKLDIPTFPFVKTGEM